MTTTIQPETDDPNARILKIIQDARTVTIDTGHPGATLMLDLLAALEKAATDDPMLDPFRAVTMMIASLAARYSGTGTIADQMAMASVFQDSFFKTFNAAMPQIEIDEGVILR